MCQVFLANVTQEAIHVPLSIVHYDEVLLINQLQTFIACQTRACLGVVFRAVFLIIKPLL